MFGLFPDSTTLEQRAELFTPPTMDETFRGILQSHADGRIDRDIEIESFHDFVKASNILIQNSSELVNMILNDINFRSIANNDSFTESLRGLVSRGGTIDVNILGGSTREIREHFSTAIACDVNHLNMRDNTFSEFPQGDIIVGDGYMSVYTNPSQLGLANYGNHDKAQSLII